MIASLSLDLDNLWSYMKVHGDPEWKRFPSFLDRAVPRILDFLAIRNVRVTVFVVGQDAALEENVPWLRAIADAGHEIGNHSFHHEPWISQAGVAEAEREIARAHEEIATATGRLPIGFRGPGFASSPALREALARRGYRYDASRLPTFVGPLARWYYFRTASLNSEQREQRAALFGSWQDGLQPNAARVTRTGEGRRLVDIPVTTMPYAKLPIHCSYLLYLDALSPALADRYFATALWLCAKSGCAPSILLHPLDFLGGDDAPQLRFFPAMDRPSAQKIAATARFVDALVRRYRVVPMQEHARRTLAHSA